MSNTNTERQSLEQPKHTPGPWKVEIDGTNTGRGPVIRTYGPYYDDGSEREIAELETSQTRKPFARSPKAKWVRVKEADEIEANARLIAAAPEMLAALKFIADRENLTFAECTDAEAIIAAARAAIAKAEGRPQ